MNSIIQGLLKQHIGIDVCLDDYSDSQSIAIEKFKKGENILLIGEAGCGKSFCLKKFKEMTTKNMYLTATTGVSAYTIGGMTINSFLGIGTGEETAQNLYRKVSNKKELVNRIRSTDILIIDEISMMPASTFEKINYILMAIRKDPKFFGGIQVIFSGDFMQATPVFKYTEDTRLLIESDLMENLNVIKLTKNFRQGNDTKYADLLSRLRVGKQTEEDLELLYSKINAKTGKDNIFLTSTNKKANEINTIKLNMIKEKEYKYNMKSKGDVNIKKDLEYQLKLKGMETLVLKKSARVMLIKNLNTDSGLVNGAMGTISEFVNGYPYVNFDNGKNIVIKEEEWKLDINGIKASVIQLPLMISYACTIHKSQSLTLESAVLDLEGCFCDHIVYVALSRLSSLNGLCLYTFKPEKITICKKSLQFSEK